MSLLTRQEAGASARLSSLKKALALSNQRNNKMQFEIALARQADTEAQRVAQRSSATVSVEAAGAPVCAKSVNVGSSTYSSAYMYTHIHTHTWFEFVGQSVLLIGCR